MAQQQQQQQWMSSMEAAWAVAAPHVSDAAAGTAWTMDRSWRAAATAHHAAALTQPAMPLDDVMGAAVASASESIIRCVLQQQPLPAAHSLGDIHIPPPLQHLPPQVKSAFFRRATMLARNAGDVAQQLHQPQHHDTQPHLTSPHVLYMQGRSPRRRCS